MLRAPTVLAQGLATYSARDGFDQTAGNLTGKVLPLGGTWTALVGDTDDFTMDTSGHTAQRATTSDTAFLGGGANGRGITAGTSNFSSMAAQVDFKWSVDLGINGLSGLIVSAVSSTVFAAVWAENAGGTDGIRVNFGITISGTSATALYLSGLSFNVATYYTLRALVATSGYYAFWLWVTGGEPGPPLAEGYDPRLGPGGALASGMIGLADGNKSGTACTRNYDNFLAWVPNADAVVNPNRSLQLATDGAVRETANGAAFGPVSIVERDLPRLPISGPEQRPVQVMVKPTRGDLDLVPDTGIDDASLRGFYRPCWLYVPDEAFNPLDLVTEGVTNVELWLRPELLGSDGSVIDQWLDSSGNGVAVTGVASARPVVAANVLDGYKVARSDGVDDLLTFSLPADTTRTFYFVARSTAALTNDKLFFGTANACLNGNSGDVSYQLNEAGAGVAYGATAANWNLYVVRVNSASSADLFLNGGGATNFDPKVDITTDTTFGLLNNTGSGECWPGDLAEVLVVDTSLGTTNHNRVRGYFSRKFPTLGSFGT